MNQFIILQLPPLLFILLFILLNLFIFVNSQGNIYFRGIKCHSCEYYFDPKNPEEDCRDMTWMKTTVKDCSFETKTCYSSAYYMTPQRTRNESLYGKTYMTFGCSPWTVEKCREIPDKGLFCSCFRNECNEKYVEQASSVTMIKMGDLIYSNLVSVGFLNKVLLEIWD